VKKAGQIVLRAADRFIGRAFRDINVGLKPIRSDRVLVNAGPLEIDAKVAHKHPGICEMRICHYGCTY
jgi:hypothetical protein